MLTSEPNITLICLVTNIVFDTMSKPISLDEITSQERVIIEYFLNNGNKAAYPAKIERELSKNISRNWASRICRKFHKAGIMDYKKIKPPRQKNKTESYFLKEDIEAFKTIAFHFLNDKKGKRNLIRSEYANMMINSNLMDYIQENLGTHFERDDLDKLLTIIELSPTALRFGLFSSETESQIENQHYDKQKNKLKKVERSIPFIDEYYKQATNESALEALQLELLVGLLTDVSEVNISGRRPPKRIESKIETKIIFEDGAEQKFEAIRNIDINILPTNKKAKYKE